MTSQSSLPAVCLSVCLSVRLYLSVCICPSCSSVCLSVSLSVSLYLFCLSVCLYPLMFLSFLSPLGIISSEELIAYGHKLSMANVTSPPVDWMPGDGRRPYPTDIEMRCGSLSRLNRDTSSDRVSEVSKPDVAMETDQPLQGVQWMG